MHYWCVFVPRCKVDGFSNKFWGWGREDDEFHRRIMDHNLQVKMSVVSWVIILFCISYQFLIFRSTFSRCVDVCIDLR